MRQDSGMQASLSNSLLNDSMASSYNSQNLIHFTVLFYYTTSSFQPKRLGPNESTEVYLLSFVNATTTAYRVTANITNIGAQLQFYFNFI